VFGRITCEGVSGVLENGQERVGGSREAAPGTHGTSRTHLAALVGRQIILLSMRRRASSSLPPATLQVPFLVERHDSAAEKATRKNGRCVACIRPCHADLAVPGPNAKMLEKQPVPSLCLARSIASLIHCLPLTGKKRKHTPMRET